VYRRLPKGAVAKDDQEPVPPLRELFDEIEETLVQAVKAGAKEIAGVLGVDFSTPPAAAVNYASERAAELVGMTRLPDGTLIENPAARWRIDSELREKINEIVTEGVREGWSTKEQIASALEPLFGVGPTADVAGWRAETIARTETGFAYNEGAIAIYRDEGIEYVHILDGKGCLPEGHEDGSPSAEPDLVGVVQAEKEADGQIWTIAQFAGLRLSHPNCTRASVPYVEAAWPTSTST